MLRPSKVAGVVGAPGGPPRPVPSDHKLAIERLFASERGQERTIGGDSGLSSPGEWAVVGRTHVGPLDVLSFDSREGGHGGRDKL